MRNISKQQVFLIQNLYQFETSCGIVKSINQYLRIISVDFERTINLRHHWKQVDSYRLCFLVVKNKVGADSPARCLLCSIIKYSITAGQY